jgi:hypothetical protein
MDKRRIAKIIEEIEGLTGQTARYMGGTGRHQMAGLPGARRIYSGTSRVEAFENLLAAIKREGIQE